MAFLTSWRITLAADLLREPGASIGSEARRRCGRRDRCQHRRLSAAAGTVGAMPVFALSTVHGPNWDDTRPIREQQAWDQHAVFMDGLVDDGFIILGGPLGNGARTLHVVEAADEQEIRTRMAEDPWASMDLLRIGTIEPWQLWLDSRRGTGEIDDR